MKRKKWIFFLSGCFVVLIIYYSLGGSFVVRIAKSKPFVHRQFARSITPNLPAIKKGILKEDVIPEYPFRQGEKFQFGIYQFGIKIGDAVIAYHGSEQIDGKNLIHVSLEAKGPAIFDREDIYGDPQTFLPVLVKRKVKVFGKDENITERYNKNGNRVVIVYEEENKASQTLESEQPLNNIILFLYYLRFRPELEVEDTFKFSLPTIDLQMQVAKKSRIKVPKGTFESFYVHSVPSRFKAWLRVEDKIPLRIDGAVGFGKTYLALIE